eukprot:gene27267-biopygen7916
MNLCHEEGVRDRHRAGIEAADHARHGVGRVGCDHQLAPNHSSGLVPPFRSRTGISHACPGLIRIGTLQRGIDMMLVKYGKGHLK